MQVILGDKMDRWNGHAAGETVSMRESLARGYIREGLAKFVATEGEKGDETPPSKKELAAYNRALRKDHTLTKGPHRRQAKRRAVDPNAKKVVKE